MQKYTLDIPTDPPLIWLRGGFFAWFCVRKNVNIEAIPAFGGCFLTQSIVNVCDIDYYVLE